MVEKKAVLVPEAAATPGDRDDLLARQPTMSDVARLANVSTATVSYLLSGRSELIRRVGPDAQERIRAAVDRLGYVQNKTARHLRRQRTERLCVLLPRLGIPFADTMANQIEQVARRRGFATVVVTADHYQGFARVVREVGGGLADGLIADSDALRADELGELIRPLSRLNRPCLLIQAAPAPPAAREDGYSVITQAMTDGLDEALAHCYAAGHRRIAYVHNHPTKPDRRSGLVRQFVAGKTDMEPPLILGGGGERGRTVERAHEIAALARRPSVVLLESDFTAVAMIAEFQRLGLHVPGDIAVIGCGNAEEGYYSNPRLTTIGPVEWSMSSATEHLIDRIEDIDGTTMPIWLTVPWKLYLRESG